MSSSNSFSIKKRTAEMNVFKFNPLGAVLLFLLVLGVGAQAQNPLQLDETCTVTIGNQTAIVRPDGSFVVPNISIFRSRDTGLAPQLFRVRATCLRNGQQISGQSGYFSLVPGNTVFIDSIFPSAIDPIPVSIAASSTKQVLAQNETAQIQVIATLPNNSTEDVTPRSQGTTYLSSNTSILTVSEDGLVTNVSQARNIVRGRISVLNEGSITTIDFQAGGPPNDLDNDGMPNDYEDLFGLNKNANDANGDLDNDGLTNKQEFDLGTLPNNPDTDGDGIPDGIDGDPLRPEENPPTVQITSPSNGDSFIEGTQINLSANATDDGRITGVEFTTDRGFSQTLNNPPYNTPLTIPLGAGPLDITATATDTTNKKGSDMVVINVLPDQPPTVQLLSPANANPLVEGQTLRVQADATDDVGIERVELIVGNQNRVLQQPPFAHDFIIPAAPQVIDIRAIAFDTRQQRTETNLLIPVLPDPGTTVIGRVLDGSNNNAPAAGAMVNMLGRSGITALDGKFFIPGVPTAQGDIAVSAVLERQGAPALRGASQLFPPVPNGIVDVGDIILKGQGVVGYYDMSQQRGNFTQLDAILLAGHIPVEILDLSLRELQSIDVLLVQNPSNNGFGFEYMNQTGLIEAEINNGLSVIIHDRHVSSAQDVLPNSANFVILRETFGDHSNVEILDPNSVIVGGPGGVLDNNSLDHGNLSTHGFAQAGSLPPNAELILSRADPTEIVTFGYPVGQGFVTYSTIPLDFYLGGSGPNPPRDNLTQIYAPNVIQFGLERAGPRPNAGVPPGNGAQNRIEFVIQGDPNASSIDGTIHTVQSALVSAVSAVQAPQILNVSVDGKDIVIEFSSSQGGQYRLECNEGPLNSNNWRTLEEGIEGASKVTVIRHKARIQSGNQCYYRVIAK